MLRPAIDAFLKERRRHFGLLFALFGALFGCRPGASAAEDQAAKLQAKLSLVQAAACLKAATQNACDPGLAVAFESPRRGVSSGLWTGSLWCEGGRPRARFLTVKGELKGEIGQVVWEAIWRVLDATDSCASVYGGAVSVTRNGETRSCKDPRFNMQSLFETAYDLARQGPPVAARPGEGPRDMTSICQIDPSACSFHTGPCPAFDGDPWNGVRGKPPEETDREPEGGSEQ